MSLTHKPLPVLTSTNNLLLPGSREKKITTIAFLLYLLLLFVGISHHELWMDELHNWNLAKGSNTFSALIYNIRFEGHPPLWYSCMWLLSKFTHNMFYLQALQYLLAAGVAWLILFRAPFPLFSRLLIPFGYYFLYEYGVLSRNYAPGLFLACCICLLLGKKKRMNLPGYYSLLFLLSNVHILCLALAASLHLYYLLGLLSERKNRLTLAGHALLGLALFLPAIYVILPPSDSSLNGHFWINHWQKQQIGIILTAPLRAFFPISAWWEDHFWNTNILTTLKDHFSSLKLFLYALFVPLTGLLYYLLKDSKKSMALCLSNLLFTCIIGVVLPLTSARYIGFIYAGFLLACWLYQYELRFSSRKKGIINLLLLLQIGGSLIALPIDFARPFSYGNQTLEVLKTAPHGELVVTDFSCFNNIVAYASQPAYCIEPGQWKSFRLWDQKSTDLFSSHRPYANGFTRFFQQSGKHTTYLISALDSQSIAAQDSALFHSFRVQLVTARTGAIEKSGNLYLYQVSTH